jgi:outer membrane protein TolC
VVEAEAAQRQKTLAPQVELARKRVEQARLRVQLGTGQRVDMAEATLRLQELETEMAKAELDLALIRRQLEQRRGER